MPQSELINERAARQKREQERLARSNPWIVLLVL